MTRLQINAQDQQIIEVLTHLPNSTLWCYTASAPEMIMQGRFGIVYGGADAADGGSFLLNTNRRKTPLMTDRWVEIDHDISSGRRIFKADVERGRKGSYGTYDFAVAADFEVRDAAGHVLFETSGSASGEYWCGVFLWFVEGSNGRKVRLNESDSEQDQIYCVPEPK